jgi:hypothetical protein
MGKPGKAVKMLEEGVSRGYSNVLRHINIRKDQDKHGQARYGETERIYDRGENGLFSQSNQGSPSAQNSGEQTWAVRLEKGQPEQPKLPLEGQIHFLQWQGKFVESPLPAFQIQFPVQSSHRTEFGLDGDNAIMNIDIIGVFTTVYDQICIDICPVHDVVLQ